MLTVSAAISSGGCLLQTLHKAIMLYPVLYITAANKEHRHQAEAASSNLNHIIKITIRSKLSTISHITWFDTECKLNGELSTISRLIIVIIRHICKIKLCVKQP